MIVYHGDPTNRHFRSQNLGVVTRDPSPLEFTYAYMHTISDLGLMSMLLLPERRPEFHTSPFV